MNKSAPSNSTPSALPSSSTQKTRLPSTQCLPLNWWRRSPSSKCQPKWTPTSLSSTMWTSTTPKSKSWTPNLRLKNSWSLSLKSIKYPSLKISWFWCQTIGSFSMKGKIIKKYTRLFFLNQPSSSMNWVRMRSGCWFKLTNRFSRCTWETVSCWAKISKKFQKTRLRTLSRGNGLWS